MCDSCFSYEPYARWTQIGGGRSSTTRHEVDEEEEVEEEVDLRTVVPEDVLGEQVGGVQAPQLHHLEGGRRSTLVSTK